MQEKIELLKKWIFECNNIVFFGGAGVSTESGIPDFRSVDGLYHLKYEYPPETILSHSFFTKYTEKFYEFYKDKMIYKDAKPNITHIKLAEMEGQGKIKAVVTQNIDGLHQKAGSKEVLELHGSVLRNNCIKCNKFYNIDIVMQSEGVPICECGGLIKPDVVLYEEGLDEAILAKTIHRIKNAEILIIGGTSLSVYPAARLIDYYKGKKLVLINKSITHYDKNVDLLIQAGLGDIFSKI